MMIQHVKGKGTFAHFMIIDNNEWPHLKKLSDIFYGHIIFIYSVYFYMNKTDFLIGTFKAKVLNEDKGS